MKTKLSEVVIVHVPHELPVDRLMRMEAYLATKFPEYVVLILETGVTVDFHNLEESW